MKNAGGKTKNRLCSARKRLGLKQRQVAFLLGHKTTDQISRYEKGMVLPNMRTALALSIIYRTPLPILFKEILDQQQVKISARLKGNAGIQSSLADYLRQEEAFKHYCAYTELLANPTLSQIEKDQVSSHLTWLSLSLAYH